MGLGNPGPSYANSPHNAGFRVADALIERWDLPKPKKKFAGELTEGRTGPGGPRVAVLKPQTFMNDSGRSVGPARGSYKLDLDRILVVHDEIDLAFGDIRVQGGRRPRRPQRAEVAQARARERGVLARARGRRPPRHHRLRHRRRPRARLLAAAEGRGRRADRRGGGQGRRAGARDMTDASSAPRDWNATSYQRVSAPLEAMGREVLDRLELRGDERVLDAGCGTGRVTAALVERLPRGEVVAVDGSPAMVTEARERLGARRRALRRRPARARARPSRSTRSSRPRRSTGSATTTGCSSACSRRCGRAAGSSPSAAAPATSPPCRRRSTRSPSRRWRAGPGRGPSPRRRRRRRGSSGSASPTSARGRRTCASSRRTRASTSPPSSSARTSSASRPSAATRSSTPCSPAMPEPAIGYVRLNLQARRPSAGGPRSRHMAHGPAAAPPQPRAGSDLVRPAGRRRRPLPRRHQPAPAARADRRALRRLGDG